MLAALIEDVGQALIRYAGRLRIGDANVSDGAQTKAPLAAVAALSASSSPAPSSDTESTGSRPTDSAPVDVDLRRLGVSQKKVLEAVRAAGRTGTTATQVAVTTGLKSTNTPRMLKTLAERGLVFSWEVNPIVWYSEHSGPAAPRWRLPRREE